MVKLVESGCEAVCSVGWLVVELSEIVVGPQVVGLSAWMA